MLSDITAVLSSGRVSFSRWISSAVMAACAGIVAPSVALAQDAFPNRAVTLIVPFAPGGATDIVGRALANSLAAQLGQPVVVENRGGAASIMGTGVGAAAKPDGYTLVMTNGAAITTGPLLGQTVPYDPRNGFTHIKLLGTFPNGLLVNASHPANNLKEFIELAREAKGDYNYGSAGVGSAGFLTGEMLQQMADFTMVHVPYKGTGPAMNDLIGNQLTMIFNNMAAAKSQADAGTIKILAVSSPKRLPDFPDVPTMDETLPGAVAEAWFGVSGPAGLDPAVQKTLYDAVSKAVQDPAYLAVLRRVGMTPASGDSADFVRFINDEFARWEPVIKKANIQLN